MYTYTQFFSIVFFLFWSITFNVFADEKSKTSEEQLLSEKQGNITELTVQQQQAIKKREKQDKVRALQRRLINKGYYSGPVNGMITPETRRAARNEMKDRD